MNYNLFSKEVDALYKAIPIPLFATLLNTIIIVFILKNQIPDPLLAAWIGLNIIVLAFRFFSFRYFRHTINSESAPKAYRIYMTGIIASGMVWGSSSLYLLPDSATHAMLLIIIVGGMVAGGVGSSSYRPESYIFYNLFVMGPYALHFMLDASNDTSWMVGTAIVLFSVMMIFASKKFHANFTETVFLQLHQQKLIETLENEKSYTQHLNQHLLEEIHEKEQYQTQLMAALEEAKQAAIAKDAFFATISHELRTPLNSVIGFSQILMKKSDVPKEFTTYAEKILISGKHLLDLVNTILDFSKIKAGKMEANKRECSLSTIFHELSVITEPMAKKRSITLEFPSPLTDTIIADATMIHQILLNLLSNAIKFSPEHTTVTIRYDSNDEYRFSICDQGQGIPPHFLDTIFEPFSQIEGANQSAIKGTGLGLAIVKEMVKAHNGNIWVESTTGKGSCFYVTLPK